MMVKYKRSKGNFKTCYIIILLAFTTVMSTFTSIKYFNQSQFYSKEYTKIASENMKWNNRAIRAEELVSSAFMKPLFVNGREKPILSLNVKATGYTARRVECDSSPETTSTGNPSRVGIIAISQDLMYEKGIKTGQLVLISRLRNGVKQSLGLFVVDDAMSPYRTGIDGKKNIPIKMSIDILHGNLKAAYAFGVQEVEIKWIGD